jgi:acyl dehydratase
MPVTNREVTDDLYREALDLVGRPVERTRQTWNTLVSADSVRHFSWGIGDDNPLWTNPEYAQASPTGPVAPPTFLYSIDSTIVFPGLEGLARLWAGNEWEWFQQVRIGDTIRAEVENIEAREVIGKRAGRMILQVGRTKYFNQDNELIAQALGSCFRTARKSVTGGLAFTPRLHSYTNAELEQIRRESISEVRRGSDPRYWEDVNEGDEVPGVIKGPLTLTDMICWYVGAMPHGRRPHELFWKELSANPDFYYGIPETGSFEFSERGHYDPFMAHEVGMPGPYDNGLQRACWLAHALTNWMGDSGVLKSLKNQVLLPNVFGDTTRVSARVARKYETNAENLVDVELIAVNQLGEINTKGVGTILLPTRDAK